MSIPTSKSKMWEGLFTPGQMARSVLWLVKNKRWTVWEQEMFEEKFFEFPPTRQLVELWCERFLKTGNVLDGIYLGKYDQRKPVTSDWFNYPEPDSPNAELESEQWSPSEKAHCVYWYESTGSACKAIQLYTHKYKTTVAPSEMYMKLWRLRFLDAGRVVKEILVQEPLETTRQLQIEESTRQINEELTMQIVEPATPTISPDSLERKCDRSRRVTASQGAVLEMIMNARKLRLKMEAKQIARRQKQMTEAEASGRPPPPEELIGQTCICRPERLARRKICSKKGPHFGQYCYVCAEPGTDNPCSFLMWDPEDTKYYKCKNYHVPLEDNLRLKLCCSTPETSNVKFLEWESSYPPT